MGCMSLHQVSERLPHSYKQHQYQHHHNSVSGFKGGGTPKQGLKPVLMTCLDRGVRLCRASPIGNVSNDGGGSARQHAVHTAHPPC